LMQPDRGFAINDTPRLTPLNVARSMLRFRYDLVMNQPRCEAAQIQGLP